MKGKLLVGVAALSLSLAACGGHGHKAATNKQLNNDTTQATAIIDKCLNKGGTFKQVEHCVVPRGHGVDFTRCTVSQFKPSVLASKVSEKAYLQTVFLCGEKYR